jgi:actin-related protein
MSKINCSVTNCSHNNENTCYSNIINVGGKSAKKDCDTCCASFLDSKLYTDLTSNINQEGNECTAITCNVGTCTYNSNNLCNAKSIDVSGKNVNFYSETNCSTFKTT